jgi:YidC/Oxa1 family membrane protein insertase
VSAYLVSQIAGSLIATRTMQGGQRGVMLALPLLFVGIVARFPAGLAVYWITTSLWTLGQQLCFWRLAPVPGVATAGPVSAPAPEAPPARPAARKRQTRKRKHGRRR